MKKAKRKTARKEKTHVVKRCGHKEKYDDKKVYASVYSAALNCHYGEKKSENIAKTTLTKINNWIKTKDMISSDQIRDEITRILKTKDKDVALMYKHHLDLS